jgi:tetratricopeptide (TPR) repeat protein
MRKKSIMPGTLSLGALCLAAFGLLTGGLAAQDAATAAPKEAIAELGKALEAAKEGSSEARQRLAVRRVVRDAETLLESDAKSPSRFLILEFLFRAQQQLIALDDDSAHRKALLETARELIKAPDELAGLRLEADLLLSQADLAKQGADTETRANALRPFVARYLDTPVAAKVLRLSMVMALELGDNRLVTDLQEMIEERFAGDLEMVSFQRDKLGGQVFGAPFSGTFERSDGRKLRFPMDLLGRSTMFLFWSKEDGGEEVLKGLAAAALEMKEELAGRLEIISFNLDELPDAGEAIVRGHGADWQVLRLPGGKKNPIYDAYVRSDPRILTVSPTGYTALIMSGSTRQKENSEGKPDYGRMFQSSLARSWTDPRYVAQLSSLMAGDFLVLDPEGGIDPTRPPELKALGEASRSLDRNADCVPEETLRAIQDCFIAPPGRYRLTHGETRASYAKAVGLCRKAIAGHPAAPDLWIVRNRLMVALLGLWKTDADLGQLDEAIAEAKTALEKGYPSGCDIVARFCIAHESLRDPNTDPGAVLGQLVADNGGENAPGPVFAVAALLALDVADRKRFEDYRGIILKDHTESPMMWTFTAFLLDRYHGYWLFQVPFTAGWSYGRREDYFMTKGDREEAHRLLRTELLTLDGEPLRIPDDLDSQWTAIIFAKPGPWSRKRDDGLPASPEGLAKKIADFAASRPPGDGKVYIAMLGGDTGAIRAGFDGKDAPCPVLTVPGGMANPLIQRLGILSEDNQINSVLIGKDGRIAVAFSGLTKQNGRGGTSITNVIERDDAKFVSAAIERGDIETAKARIFSLAPSFDPEARDDRGRPLKKPQYGLAHLSARARVYMAIEDWDKALADAEEVVQRQLGTDGGMSLRTDELDEAEQLRDKILKPRSKQEESK